MPGPSARTARLRPVALMTPAVTLGSLFPRTNPNGLPMAIAHSPTTRSFELPSLTTGRFLASILSTAMSLSVSAPRSRAGKVVPSASATEMRVAPTTTCALVMTTPSARVMNPDPRPGSTRVPGRPRNASSGPVGPRSIISVCTVTTAGATWATASVIAVRRDSTIDPFTCALPRGLPRASRTNAVSLVSARSLHATRRPTATNRVNRISYSGTRSRDALAPVFQKLTHAAISQRVHQQVAQHRRRNGGGVGASARAADEVHQSAHRCGNELALEPVIRENLARLRNDRDALLTDVLEPADERAHVSCTGLRRQQRLCSGEDECRADANPLGGETTRGDDSFLEHRHHHDDAVGDLREITPLAIHAIRIDCHDLGRDGSTHRACDLAQVVARIGLGVLLRQQRWVRCHAIDEANSRGPDDLGQRRSVEEDL